MLDLPASSVLMKLRDRFEVIGDVRGTGFVSRDTLRS